tara:strand:+ start:3427 stop:4785 length:1359 start_codon:yes stop_codon:yes gene_type:complete
MTVFRNALEMVGNTPILELSHFDTGPCRLFVKLESQNPGGSIKDRIALAMIGAAEKSGQLKPGGTIIEATAGNTGLGLGLIAALKGYKMIIVMPDKMSPEKIAHLRAIGAKVVMTRSDVQKGHPQYYQDLAQSIADNTDNCFYANQFGNPVNAQAHEHGTAEEIWQQMDNKVDAIVCGVGTGGTLTGVGRYFKNVSPTTEIVIADPKGSIIADLVNTGKHQDAGSWLIEGIGEDFVPSICDISLASCAYTVTDKQAFATVRELLASEGILAGSSSGALLHAALQYCREQTTAKNVVTFICDTGNKYLSKAYNNAWLQAQGLIEREQFGDLRDLIPRRFADGTVITAQADEPLLNVINRFKQHGFSQLPVLDGSRYLGLITEHSIVEKFHPNAIDVKCPVESCMVEGHTLQHHASLEDVHHIIAQRQAAVILDSNNFLGLITTIDLLTHLQEQ